MPRKKKIARAAKIRVKSRLRNLNTDQLVANDDDDDEYIPSNDYSEDSSDNEYIDKRIKNLDNSFLIWSSNAHNKLKKSYTGNSRATKFKKYGPSGTFTKAAKLSQPITNFFHKSQEASGEFKIGDDYELEDERNDDKLKDNDEIEDDIDELKEDNNDELDDNDEELEEDNGDELEDDDEELEEDNGDKLEDKYDDDKLKDKDDDNGMGNESELENNNFNSKLIKLEEILSRNLKKMMAYDYLHYRAVYMFFKKWKYDNLNKEQASLHSAKVVYNKGTYKAK
ncbi:hypothetical protein RhiirC2_719119 [Rhizophagus irregularis]|uniref:Uncharacterized protein n=1 Tax=Rhizophagus irregularis TaxID=588596 RepID=A0A2N1MFK6_9GLOM|nr:hypothetical protein RhiirC2_719119 [Rhizophagus irregularis]